MVAPTHGPPNLKRTMGRAFLIPQRPISIAHGNCETLCLIRHSDHARAPIAPIARQKWRGRRPIVVPSIPPRAATRGYARRASRVQRRAPRSAAAGWLRVGNAGDRKISAAPARTARRSSIALCAELVTSRRYERIVPARRPARRWMPACSAAARDGSPATTSARRRARQMRARSRPSAARSAASSWRRTMPARPRGRRLAAWRGSGSRCGSVNSQSGGTLG